MERKNSKFTLRPFSKKEIFGTVVIFLILVLVSLPNFVKSLRRSRDQTRRDDLGTIQKMADSFYAKNKFFPDNLSELGNVPNDPNSSKGTSYLYLVGPDMFQIFVAQEGIDEPEYDLKIVARNLKCGSEICNSGRNYNCPVDKSIDECSIINK